MDDAAAAKQRGLPIYVDLDDVIADSTSRFVEIVRREFGREVGIEDVTSFDLGVSFGLSSAEYAAFFQAIHEPDVLTGFDPIDGATDVLRKWSDSGYAISIVTGRPAYTIEASVTWLGKHGVPYDTFLVVDKYNREKEDAGSALSMAELAEMTFCFAVEDSVPMARHLSEHMALTVALFDRPWNRKLPANPRIGRCRTWREIARRFDAVNGDVAG